MIQIFLAMQPPRITAQTQGRRSYKSPALIDARQKLIAALAPQRPTKPMSGPLRLTVKWIWCTKKKSLWGTYKLTRPDTDNLQKALKDVMQFCHYFADDALVASEVIEKFWDGTPGIFVRLEQIENRPSHEGQGDPAD